MTHIALVVILVVLVLANIIVGSTALILRRDLVECETEESPYCPSYVCPNGEAATRTDSDGNTQTST